MELREFNMMNRNWQIHLLACCIATVAFGACGNGDSPAGPSVTISAPTIIGPSSGEEVTENQPSLTAGNVSVSDGSQATYTFQVATDSGFSNIVAQTTGIPQGAEGETSWQVDVQLTNVEHFWRARGRAAGTDGPYSAVADFTVLTAFKSKNPQGGLLVFDPLTTRSTVGIRKGGQFTDEGWLTTSRSNEIIYNVPTIVNGFMEVDMVGLKKLNDGGSGARHLFTMWDPTKGDFTRNRWRAGVQKHTRNSTDTMRYLRMRWIFDGRERHDVFSGFLDWEEGRVYHFRLEWGKVNPSNADNETKAVRLIINGQQFIFFNHLRDYAPPNHRIALGASQRFETPVAVVYSNVRIGIRD
jgi:hypothetical protein